MGKERNVPWEEILRRRKEGETARALAEEFGVSVESVYKRGQRERLEQRGSLQQAARNLCRSAGSMVAQMEDMDAKELKELTALLREHGWQVGNVDTTVVAQAPKLAPYIPEMRRRLAEAMGLDVDCVSVKATTEERLGFTGSGAGMAAHAVALIERLN